LWNAKPFVGRPVALARGQPRDAFVDAPLHLHHVGRRVHGPAVAPLDRQCGARRLLGLLVLVALLEAERVHAEHVRVAGHLVPPVRQHARDAVAQVERVAAVEVHQVRDLQRERVARVVDEHRVERRARVVPGAVRQVLRGGGQPALARVGLRAVLARQRHGVGDGARVLALGERREHERLERVAGDEVGRGDRGAVDRGDRVADVRVQLADRRLVEGDRFGGSGRQRDPAGIVLHGALSFRASRLRSGCCPPARAPARECSEHRAP
jgi:hypothetical protein